MQRHALCRVYVDYAFLQPVLDEERRDTACIIGLVLFYLLKGREKEDLEADGAVLVRQNVKRSISFTDVGTEELAHLEMIGTIVHQLTRCLNEDDIRKAGFDAYYVDHTAGIYPASTAGVAWTASYMQSKGDILTDLHEDLAAEAASMYVQCAAKAA